MAAAAGLETKTTTRVADFNALAGVYRWMEWLSFGPWLGLCRTAFLPEVAGARSALVFGDGDGRFTARLLRSAPRVEVEAVDASEAMLKALLRRAGPNAGRVRAMHGDARAWPAAAGTWPGGGGEACEYDLIVTHFFLDCLTTDEVSDLAREVAAHSAAGAHWLVSEFAVPAGPFGRWVARPIIGFLYRAFGWLTGLKIRNLPDHALGLRQAGFALRQRRTLLGGLLVAELWALAA